jgi:hypothetical protein
VSTEGEHQEKLVFRLRAHGGIEDAAHGADLFGAASELERLAEQADNEQVAFFERLHRTLADAVREFVLHETGYEAKVNATDPEMVEVGDSGVRGGTFDLEVQAPGQMFIAVEVAARRPMGRRTYEIAALS